MAIPIQALDSRGLVAAKAEKQANTTLAATARCILGMEVRKAGGA
jgi:hypothetical protein